LRDRKNLSESGLIIAVATVSMQEGVLMSGPEIISRGFVYVRENEELILGAKEICQKAIIDALNSGVDDWAELKNIMKNALTKYIFAKTKRKPVILPILMDL
jgi:ribonuclease J